MIAMDRQRGTETRAGRTLPWVVAVVVGGLFAVTSASARIGAQSADEAAPDAPAVGQPAPGSPEELAYLQKLQRQEALDAQRARTAQQRRLEDLFFEQSSIERTNEQLDRLIRESEADLVKQREKLAGFESQVEEHGRTTKALREQLTVVLDELEARVDAGIPWKQNERREQIAKARNVLSDERTSAAGALQTVDRLVKEQEALGRLVESQKLELQLKDGTKLAVQAFHLGLLATIFANETGDILGYAGPGDILEQGVEIVKDRPDAADGYLLAADILRRRRTPQLVNIFMPTLPVAKGEAQ